MSRTPTAALPAATGGETGALAPAPAARARVLRGGRDDALRAILAPGRFVVGAVADTGVGKSYGLQVIATAALAAGLVRRIYVHDTQSPDAECRWPGLRVAGLRDWRRRGGWQLGDPRWVVFRDEDTSPEVVARVSYADEYSASLYDEIDLAVTARGGDFHKGCPTVRKQFMFGRKRSNSVLWTGQTLQRAPLLAYALSTSMQIYRNDESMLPYLDEKLRPPAWVLEFVPRLEPHDFLLRIKSHWDPRVWRF